MASKHTRALELAAVLIKRFEGFSSKVYRDPVGLATIGYGVRVAPGHAPISRAEGEAMLAAMLPSYATPVLTDAHAAPAHAQAACISWVWNLGVARWRASTFRRKMRAGDYEAAAEECRKWVWAGGVKLPGLIRRREVEAALIWPGSYS